MDDREPEYADPTITELTDVHTRMLVALDLLSNLHSRLLYRTEVGRQVDRPPEYQEKAEQLRDLTHDLAGLCDQMGRKINDKLKAQA